MAEERPETCGGSIVAAEPVTDVDTTAADMLADLDEWLNERGVSLVFAELKDPVKEKIERYELTRTIDPGALLPDHRRGGARLRRRDGRQLARSRADAMSAPDTPRRPSARQQAAAWVALVAVLGVIAFLVLQAVRRWDVLVVTVLSLALLVVAAWFALSRRGRPRVAALVVGVVSLVVFAVVILASESIRVLVVGLVLAALAVGAARLALLPPTPGPSHDDAPGPIPGAPRPAHPVLLMNLRSGGGKAERFDLVGQCLRRGIEPVVLTPGSTCWSSRRTPSGEGRT